MSDTSADLQMTSLTKQFVGTAGTLDVLTGVDLTMRRGDAVVITGPSGSGKSTLLYIIGVLDEPTAGEINVSGTLPLKMSPAEQAKFRNESVGFVFQDHHLLPQCTVLENVLIPTLAGAKPASGIEERARKLLDRVGLSDRIMHRPGQLSGGERQRVGICRALINEPLLLLADEPTGNLDQKTAEAVGSLLLEVAREQNTMLLCVTHSLDLAARFPRRYELTEGKLVEFSP
ncbi:MAG: ABC transporter ATP-binding protein [Planctomycetaceae bacterium]|nr:ABC transporter ATP-binding protein [Planctomycetaceae bacterium]